MKKIRRQVVTNKTRILISLLLLSLTLLFCLTTVSAASGDNVYVNGSSGNDSWDGQSAIYNSTTGSGPKLSIKNATGTVNTNGTMYIANGVYTGANNTGITIDKNLNIIGESQDGSIINGEDTNWIFYIVSGVNVTIQNLTLANGTTTNFGGAIYAQNGNLTVNDCTFTGNTATSGGAIYNYGGSCNVAGCTFTGNTATYYGGAIRNLCNCTVTGSTFNGNTATSGGAIYNVGSSCNVTGCTFTGNIATAGGAIRNLAGTCTVQFNRIVDNHALTGSAIYNAGSVDAVNNWWGTNNPNWSNLIFTFGFTNLSNWVVLTLNANPATINNGETSTITGDFNHINGGGDLVGGHIPDGSVTLDIPWGSFTSSGITHSITLNTINGAIAATFYADEGPVNPLFNPVMVTATADGYTTNDTESAYITINPAADISVNTTFEDNNHNHITSANYQDTVIIHLKVTNNGPDTADWVVINDIIPPELDDSPFDVTSNSPAWGYVYYYGSQRLTIYIADIANGASYDVWINVTNVRHNNSIITNTACLNTTETDPYDPNPDNNNSTVSYTAKTSANLYILITSNKDNPKVGETFTLTYKLGNNGPDNATNVTITIPLQDGFEYTNISGDGSWTYDATTRTITWAMANVEVGDPYIYITGKVTKSGTYVFSSSISSETYNIDSEDVTPITINAVNEVKAASKTIPLRHTGLHLEGLILAVLAVFGGLLSPKRK